MEYGWDCSVNRKARIYKDASAVFCDYWGKPKHYQGTSIQEAKDWVDQQRLTVETDRSKHRQALGLSDEKEIR